jgi:signal transduction histidine kinase
MLSEPNSASSPTAHITRPHYLAPEETSHSTLQQQVRRPGQPLWLPIEAQQGGAGAQNTTYRNTQTLNKRVEASDSTLEDGRYGIVGQAVLQWRQRLSKWLLPFFSLRWQLPLVFTALFVLLLLILSGFIYGSVATQLYNNGLTALPQRVLGSNGVREQLINDIYCQGLPPSTALRSTEIINASNDIDAIYVVDSGGRVIVSSDGTLLHRAFPYINAQVLSSSTGKSFATRDMNGEPIGIFLTRLMPPRSTTDCSQSVVRGYLAVTTSYSAEHAILNSLFLMIVIAAIIITAAGAAAIFFFTNLLLSPLRHMRDAAQAIALGDLKQRVRLPRSNDEVGALAVSFNEMVDQLERAFEQQRASEQRTRRFVSDASHELRTPLTSLRGFTDVLMRGAKDDAETLQRSLKLMKNETERMSRLINDLLTLARLDEGYPLQIESVDILDMATEAVEQTRILAVDGRNVSLQLVTQDEQLEVQADVDRLKQVLLILCDNAIKYGRPGAEGWIMLAIDKRDSTIFLSVIDNGKGIPAKDIPLIFERFYRGRSSPISADGTPISGAGLGLSIALAIVRAHRGDIAVQIDSGKSTIFTVMLPFSEIYPFMDKP